MSIYRVSVARVLDLDIEPRLEDLKFFMGFGGEPADAVRSAIESADLRPIDVHLVSLTQMGITVHGKTLDVTGSWTYKAEVRERSSSEVLAFVAGGVSRLER